jgi:hypothetical protein
MEALKNLPIGIQDFESLRNDGYLYVDKTAYVYQLITTNRYYFLSRPRRFGKSMLISTLHAYFDGKKELFNGLAIAELEKDWTKYPVLHLDLNNLMDISMDREYVGICGITDEEIDTLFAPYVARLADELEISVTEAREELRQHYDGYHFCEKSVGIYNPFSLLRLA